MANKEMARRVQSIIVDKPERYNQTSWFWLNRSTIADAGMSPGDYVEAHCPTTACVAGHVTQQMGFKPSLVDMRVEYTDNWEEDTVLGYLLYRVYDPKDETDADGNYPTYSVQGAAAEGLGIPMDLADWLFQGTRELEEVLVALEFLAEDNEEGLRAFINDDIPVPYYTMAMDCEV